MIRFDNATRTYGRKVAVDRLTLSIGRGELFALLGPNGAGKTTTIKMLVGLLRPDAGPSGSAAATWPPRPAQPPAASSATCPRSPSSTTSSRGGSSSNSPPRCAACRPPTSRPASPGKPSDFDLADFLDDLIETYSHGMKQRLVFASALLHDPAVLVVDEPMVGLDPRSVRVVKDLLRSRAAAGAAVFMSTHTLAVAEEIADRIGILNGGRLHFLGTLAELRQELSSPHASLEPLFLELTGGNHRRGEERSTCPTVTPSRAPNAEPLRGAAGRRGRADLGRGRSAGVLADAQPAGADDASGRRVAGAVSAVAGDPAQRAAVVGGLPVARTKASASCRPPSTYAETRDQLLHASSACSSSR